LPAFSVMASSVILLSGENRRSALSDRRSRPM
jgi:hypothetical protein